MAEPRHPRALLVRAARLSAIPGVTMAEACERYGVGRSAVARVKKGLGGAPPSLHDLLIAALSGATAHPFDPLVQLLGRGRSRRSAAAAQLVGDDLLQRAAGAAQAHPPSRESGRAHDPHAGARVRAEPGGASMSRGLDVRNADDGGARVASGQLDLRFADTDRGVTIRLGYTRTKPRSRTVNGD
jgi:hypothetical protein